MTAIAQIAKGLKRCEGCGQNHTLNLYYKSGTVFYRKCPKCRKEHRELTKPKPRVKTYQVTQPLPASNVRELKKLCDSIEQNALTNLCETSALIATRMKELLK